MKQNLIVICNDVRALTEQMIAALKLKHNLGDDLLIISLDDAKEQGLLEVYIKPMLPTLMLDEFNITAIDIEALVIMKEEFQHIDHLPSRNVGFTKVNHRPLNQRRIPRHQHW